ncbi:MAG: type I DNA topoisomerase [Candidatus Hydrogenedentes bacterium]|nr:type I DNA topoisomerase [Candidatus Hydrogenedentota bacterium]
MSKYLVVVESPAKAKTINKFLGSNYVVKASMGHVRDLPKNEFGVDVENNFTPTYVTLKESAKAVKALKDAAAKAERVYLASDPDREGEAIGWHVAELLRPAKKSIERIVFNEITKRSVLEAAKHPRAIGENLVNAQQARRILDRLVGYRLSPLLQWSVRKGLSAGRVQSVAVRMVCDREAEIRAFVPVEYWTLDATMLTQRNDTFVARLNRIAGEKAQVGNEAEMQAILADLQGASYTVAEVERKEVRRRPYPPFITSTLQQEASRKLGFGPRKTMIVAQQLYEGVTLGDEGSVGLISYMRTDSTRLSQEALDEARQYIREKFEPAMLPEKPNIYASKRGAQDAHEAIRPTSVYRTPDSVRSHLDGDQFKLYALIWTRFLACQMAPAVLDQMTIDVTAKHYELRAVGSAVKFPGFTKLYEETVEDVNGDQPAPQPLPDVVKGETVSCRELKPEQHFTKPPSRYSEASLIRALEENGIGRPSTYAPTINTILERGYVEREKGRLKPTDLGEQVNALLLNHFPDILDLNFTAQMEADLDHVEEGRREWHDLLRAFYVPFTKEIAEAQRKMVGTLLEETPICPNCGAPMEMREGRYGVFIACHHYPKCKTTRRLERKTVEATDEKCDKCGAPMVIRSGRFGRFLACTTYPKCKNTHNLDKEGRKIVREPRPEPKMTDQKCPECGAFLVIRKSRRDEEFYGCKNYPKCKYTRPMELGLKCPRPGCTGNLAHKLAKRRRFIGCDRYPQCDFIVFGQLDKQTPCPKCGNSWTTVSKSRSGPAVRRCPAPACGYQREEENDSAEAASA